MSPSRRRSLVRAAGVVGATTQLLVGLMGIVIFPAAFVSVITAVAGTRLVGRDLEAASMRFGIALLASGVGVVFGLASGALPMIGAAAVSTGCLALAWTGVQRLASEHRAAFGIKHRDWERRDTELHARRDALRNGRADGPSGAERPTDDVATPDAADPWWEDLR